MLNTLHKFMMGLMAIGLLALSACELDPVNDPNNPSLGAVTALVVWMAGPMVWLEGRGAAVRSTPRMVR